MHSVEKCGDEKEDFMYFTARGNLQSIPVELVTESQGKASERKEALLQRPERRVLTEQTLAGLRDEWNGERDRRRFIAFTFCILLLLQMVWPKGTPWEAAEVG